MGKVQGRIPTDSSKTAFNGTQCVFALSELFRVLQWKISLPDIHSLPTCELVIQLRIS